MRLPFVPADPQPLLKKNASAPQQFSRLLDALLLLEAQGSCDLAGLAHQVGLDAQRLRELLSAFTWAGYDVLGHYAPFSIDVVTQRTGGEVVRLSSAHGTGTWLLDGIGLRPVLVRDVARALLCARVLVEGGQLPPRQREGVEVLAGKLSQAMHANVSAPATHDAAVLHAAVHDRQRVRFRYLHPWTGEATVVETEPYDVRRRRDRLVLDAAGDPFTTYDVGGMSELEVVGPAGAFDVPVLPAAADRTTRVEVVLRVPAYSDEERWLLDGWTARVVGPAGDGQLDVRVQLDGDVADAGVVQRLGVLLLQLGPAATVVRPEQLRGAALSVGRRLREAHGG